VAGDTLMDHWAIAETFNACFEDRFHTVMVGGADEPLYIPPSPSSPGELRYREDYPASALHEAAHWCIAGPERRKQLDFGYTYTPPPRNPHAQVAFFAGEARAQALESIFAQAACVRFVLSIDDLESLDRRRECSEAFAAGVEVERQRVNRQIEAHQLRRAAQFAAALAGKSDGLLGVGRTCGGRTHG
jgi:elongation factor P hydroxylase